MRNVVTHAITKNMGKSFSRRDIEGGFRDDGDKLAFVVEARRFLCRKWNRDW